MKGDHRVHGRVFASLVNGEFRILLLPETGHAEGAYRDVPTADIPFECRRPNALVWVTFGSRYAEVLKIEAREVNDQTPMY
jgi:hypothetical protein